MGVEIWSVILVNLTHYLNGKMVAGQRVAKIIPLKMIQKLFGDFYTMSSNSTEPNGNGQNTILNA